MGGLEVLCHRLLPYLLAGAWSSEFQFGKSIFLKEEVCFYVTEKGCYFASKEKKCLWLLMVLWNNL